MKIGTIDSLTFKSPGNCCQQLESTQSGKEQDHMHLKELANKRALFFVSEISKAKQQIGIGIRIQVIYQTRETVFHQDIQTPRRELKI